MEKENRVISLQADGIWVWICAAVVIVAICATIAVYNVAHENGKTERYRACVTAQVEKCRT